MSSGNKIGGDKVFFLEFSFSYHIHTQVMVIIYHLYILFFNLIVVVCKEANSFLNLPKMPHLCTLDFSLSGASCSKYR